MSTMAETLDPNALAACGDAEEDARPGVQPVTWDMIYNHVVGRELPEQSAKPFADYLDEEWNDYVDDPADTNGKVLAGALEFWRGQ